jgi:hypothetical protein
MAKPEEPKPEIANLQEPKPEIANLQDPKLLTAKPELPKPQACKAPYKAYIKTKTKKCRAKRPACFTEDHPLGICRKCP